MYKKVNVVFMVFFLVLEIFKVSYFTLLLCLSCKWRGSLITNAAFVSKINYVTNKILQK